MGEKRVAPVEISPQKCLRMGIGMEKQSRIAVLIDAENVSKKYAKLIMDEVNDDGIATYKRIYGDFTNASVSSWQEKVREFALTPVFQFNYTKGKNASDAALIIDAMDILYSNNVDGFCLVTSDSDFTKLAIRLREAGMMVIGMGERKTPNSLVSACEKFKYLDLLYQESEDEENEGAAVSEQEEKRSAQKVSGQKGAGKNSGKEELPDVSAEAVKTEAAKEEPREEAAEEEQLFAAKIPTMKELGREIRSIIDLKSGDDGWVDLSEIGVSLSKRVPGFDPRNYKYTKLSKLIKGFAFAETKEVRNPNNPLLKSIYVRIRER